MLIQRLHSAKAECRNKNKKGGVSMLIKEFVKNVLNDIFPLKDKLDKNVLAERANIDILVRLESRLFVSFIYEQLKKSNGLEAPVTDAFLKDFIDILRNRWEHLQKTDAIFCHIPDSFGNRVSGILAWHIAKALNKHPYEILMPNIPLEAFNVEQELKTDDIKKLKLPESILDDDRHPLKIAECLDVYSKKEKL